MANQQNQTDALPLMTDRAGLQMLIAGALFDFAGYLTTRDRVIEVGSTALATPVADLLDEFAKMRGLALDAAAIASWAEALATRPQQARDAVALLTVVADDDPIWNGMNFIGLTEAGQALPAGKYELIVDRPQQAIEPLTEYEFTSLLDSAGLLVDVELALQIKDVVEDAHGIAGTQPQRSRKSQWVPVDERLPPSGVTVLACYINRCGHVRRIRAAWVAAKSSEASSESDIGEYDEATDAYYDPEGWYEQIDNWDVYTAVGVNEGEITHWIPLPAAPSALVREAART